MIAGRIPSAYLLDHGDAARVLIGFILASSFAAVVLALGITLATAPLTGALMGLIFREELSARRIVPRYDGERSFAVIYGMVAVICQLGAGVAVASMGYGRHLPGRFRPSKGFSAA
jgi:hypothetical protein